ASCGLIGRSGAITSALGSTSRMRLTVPDCPLLPKPCTYMIFFPSNSSGNCLIETSAIIKSF
ncbi:MAG: hypothetical protein IJM12_01460, partial [Bacteroidales bacterium]|nr:hypothetical protein [Bacteroidales bacterium]